MKAILSRVALYFVVVACALTMASCGPRTESSGGGDTPGDAASAEAELEALRAEYVDVIAAFPLKTQSGAGDGADRGCGPAGGA